MRWWFNLYPFAYNVFQRFLHESTLRPLIAFMRLLASLLISASLGFTEFKILSFSSSVVHVFNISRTESDDKSITPSFAKLFRKFSKPRITDEITVTTHQSEANSILCASVSVKSFAVVKLEVVTSADGASEDVSAVNVVPVNVGSVKVAS